MKGLNCYVKSLRGRCEIERRLNQYHLHQQNPKQGLRAMPRRTPYLDAHRIIGIPVRRILKQIDPVTWTKSGWNRQPIRRHG